MVYSPQEDSLLLKSFVHQYAKGNVLDMGTGSGIQAFEAANEKRVDKVIAVDIDAKAISHAKKANKHPKIKYIKGDLFKPLKNKRFRNFFDTIIFNAPYLPQEHKKIRHIDLEGGIEGHETIEKFLSVSGNYLAEDGMILLVFSSHTPHMPDIFAKYFFDVSELGKIHQFFEDIVVVMLTKNNVKKELAKKGVKNIEFFAKGKRGFVFKAELNKKPVAIKIKNPQSTAQSTIEIESNILKEINKQNIGPKYYFHTENSIVMEFVKGKTFQEILKKSKRQIKQISKEILRQCIILDKMNISKDEMTRPFKNVIVNKNKVTLLDFERARKGESANNVTQFCQFIGNWVDRKNKNKWIQLAQEYSKSHSDDIVAKMEIQLK